MNAEDLRPFRQAAPDYYQTEQLKGDLRRLRSKRAPFYLTRDELERIFYWKLGNQYNRVAERLEQNTESGYKAITTAALSIIEDDADYEVQLRLGVLMSLSGVGIGVASAILALCDPDKYCVIDFRGWRTAFFPDECHNFGLDTYLRYLHEVKRLTNALNWTPMGSEARLEPTGSRPCPVGL